MKLYKTLAEESSYGNDSWLMTKRVISRFQAAEMRFVRPLTRMTRLDMVGN
jgi:hypothetical protein